MARYDDSTDTLIMQPGDDIFDVADAISNSLSGDALSAKIVIHNASDPDYTAFNLNVTNLQVPDQVRSYSTTIQYTQGTIVSQNDSFHEAISDFTVVGGTFDQTQWTDLGDTLEDANLTRGIIRITGGEWIYNESVTGTTSLSPSSGTITRVDLTDSTISVNHSISSSIFERRTVPVLFDNTTCNFYYNGSAESTLYFITGLGTTSIGTRGLVLNIYKNTNGSRVGGAPSSIDGSFDGPIIARRLGSTTQGNATSYVVRVIGGSFELSAIDMILDTPGSDGGNIGGIVNAANGLNVGVYGVVGGNSNTLKRSHNRLTNEAYVGRNTTDDTLWTGIETLGTSDRGYITIGYHLRRKWTDVTGTTLDGVEFEVTGDRDRNELSPATVLSTQIISQGISRSDGEIDIDLFDNDQDTAAIGFTRLNDIKKTTWIQPSPFFVAYRAISASDIEVYEPQATGNGGGTTIDTSSDPTGRRAFAFDETRNFTGVNGPIKFIPTYTFPTVLDNFGNHTVFDRYGRDIGDGLNEIRTHRIRMRKAGYLEQHIDLTIPTTGTIDDQLVAMIEDVNYNGNLGDLPLGIPSSDDHFTYDAINGTIDFDRDDGSSSFTQISIDYIYDKIADIVSVLPSDSTSNDIKFGDFRTDYMLDQDKNWLTHWGDITTTSNFELIPGTKINELTFTDARDIDYRIDGFTLRFEISSTISDLEACTLVAEENMTIDDIRDDSTVEVEGSLISNDINNSAVTVEGTLTVNDITNGSNIEVNAGINANDISNSTVTTNTAAGIILLRNSSNSTYDLNALLTMKANGSSDGDNITGTSITVNGDEIINAVKVELTGDFEGNGCDISGTFDIGGAIQDVTVLSGNISADTFDVDCNYSGGAITITDTMSLQTSTTNEADKITGNIDLTESGTYTFVGTNLDDAVITQGPSSGTAVIVVTGSTGTIPTIAADNGTNNTDNVTIQLTLTVVPESTSAVAKVYTISSDVATLLGTTDDGSDLVINSGSSTFVSGDEVVIVQRDLGKTTYYNAVTMNDNITVTIVTSSETYADSVSLYSTDNTMTNFAGISTIAYNDDGTMSVVIEAGGTGLSFTNEETNRFIIESVKNTDAYIETVAVTGVTNIIVANGASSPLDVNEDHIDFSVAGDYTLILEYVEQTGTDINREINPVDSDGHRVHFRINPTGITVDAIVDGIKGELDARDVTKTNIRRLGLLIPTEIS